MPKRVIVAEGPEFLKREGLESEPVPWEDGLRGDTGPGTFEWWYFDAHLEDGSTAVIVYLTKPLLQRNDPLTPTLAITITRPDGQQIRDLPVYLPGQFRAARDRCDVTIGPSWVRGDLRRYELHAEGKALSADLVFTGHVPPWRPAAGKWYYDEGLTGYFGWFLPIPFGHVEGTLTYDGHTRQVSGTGYHDHNWGNVGLNDVMSHWYWGRAHLGDYSLIFVEMVGTEAYAGQKVPNFMLAKGDRILTGDGHPLTLQTAEFQEHPSGKRYPRKADFHWQAEAGTVHLTLRAPKIIEAISMLYFLPAWKKWLARRFVNPYYFRFNADLDLTVDFAGIRDTQHGTALFELMFLH